MRLAWIVVPLCLVGCAAPRAQDRPVDFGTRAIDPPRRPSGLEVQVAELATALHCANQQQCFIEVEVEDKDIVDPVSGKRFTCWVKRVRPGYFLLQGPGAIHWRIVSTNSEHRFPPPPSNPATKQTGIEVVGNDPMQHFEDAQIDTSRLRLHRSAKGKYDLLYHYNIEVVRNGASGDVPCMLHDPIIINRP